MVKNSVLNFMVRNPINVSLDTSVTEIAKLMLAKSISSIIIEKDKKSIGIVTERDIVRRVVAFGLDPNSTKVFEICTKPVISILAFEEVDVAVEKMREHKIRRLVVVDQHNNVIGIITTDDIGYDLKNISEKIAIKYISLMSRR